jgi:hypothetical protein
LPVDTFRLWKLWNRLDGIGRSNSYFPLRIMTMRY